MQDGRGGVAVVLVRTDKTGLVREVDVLEAPTPSIGVAVTTAVSKWKFKPNATMTVARRTLIKLTFYFVLAGNDGHVLSPSEAPYVGPAL
jgi:TonB family protein